MSTDSNKNPLVVHTTAQIRIAMWYDEERTYGNAGKDRAASRTLRCISGSFHNKVCCGGLFTVAVCSEMEKELEG